MGKVILLDEIVPEPQGQRWLFLYRHELLHTMVGIGRTKPLPEEFTAPMSFYKVCAMPYTFAWNEM